MLEGRTASASPGTWPAYSAPLAQSVNGRYAIAAPLVAKDRVIGTFCCVRRTDRPFLADEVELIETCAAHMAVAIERARLFETERSRARDLSLINELGSLISGELDLSGVLESGVRHLARMAEVPQVFLLLLENGHLRVAASTLEGAIGTMIEPGESALGRCAIEERRALIVNEPSSDPRASQARVKRFAQTALLGVPMFARGAPIGAVLLARTEPDCPFGGEEVDRAVAMVNQLATAIANARLFDLAQASDRLAGASWRQGPADSGVALARPLWLNGSRMKKRDLDVIRQSLQRARAQALSSSPTRIEPNRKDETQVGVADEDAQALSEMLQVLSSQRNKGQKELVARIDRAMRRLESAPDDFGLCEDCEEDIPRKRLQLVPYATLCAACQSKRDPVRGAARKKITDYQ